MDEAVDLAIIGAGVLGCAVASAAARCGLEVVILEREAREGTGVTSRNSGVIHGGIYYPPGSLKARSCLRGQALLYAWAAERGVAHARTGKLIIARRGAEIEALQAILHNALASGARACELIGPQEIARREPALPPCLAALWSPQTGIVDAHGLTRSLLVDACERGAVLVHSARVEGIARVGEGYALDTTRGPLRAQLVVNAAGLHADTIANTLGVKARIYPCRGDYFRLKTARSYRHLIYPVRLKTDPGLGVHLTLELDGAVRMGPDAEYVSAREDFSPAEHKHAAFLAATRRLLGDEVRADQLSYDGCGIRPKLRPPEELAERDFVIVEQPAGCVHLLGIESPGLTASLDLAERVVSRLT